MTGNQIIDPCFSDPGNPQGNEVACPTLRDLTSDTVIRLRQALDPSYANKDNPGADPWALSIEGGAVCDFITGATDTVAGRRLNYGCSDKTALYGDPDRSSPLWKILQGTQGSAELAPVAVVHAWE
jgi:hypothetical protein